MNVFHKSQVELATDTGVNLVARAQRGEEAAFTALYDAYKRCVYGLCLRTTQSPQEAKDLTEEAFLRVFRRIAAFRSESAFSTRLQLLAVNAILMHLRKKRSQEVPFERLAETCS
jgi:RNA polymerase sigma-70 factor, ECF subfamily